MKHFSLPISKRTPRKLKKFLKKAGGTFVHGRVTLDVVLLNGLISGVGMVGTIPPGGWGTLAHIPNKTYLASDD